MENTGEYGINIHAPFDQCMSNVEWMNDVGFATFSRLVDVCRRGKINGMFKFEQFILLVVRLGIRQKLTFRHSFSIRHSG
ncbi:hypothetical protein D3C87_1582580 [compost metagenome]